jgi:ABC-type protease/lipase transport system fused ATPase/permease subunit
MAAARKSNPVDEALKLGTNPLLFAGLFSLVSNVLYLSFPIYTNQVFTRVLSSHSAATLMVLTAGVLIVFALSSALDALRAKVLTNFGLVFDRYLAGPLFAALFETAVRRNPVARAQVVGTWTSSARA